MPTPLPERTRAFVRAAPVHRGVIASEVRSVAEITPAGSRVLDAGAGDAPYRPLFAHCDYLTQDWTESPHPGARSADVIADLADLPLDDASIDVVICTEVLEHVGDPARAVAELARAVAELARVLRPGGTILLTVPFVGELHEEPYDFSRFTPYAIARLLRDAGFTAIETKPLTGWYSTLAHVLRHNALATRHPDHPSARTLAASWLVLVLSELARRVAPALDRLDERRALPLGWAARAVKGPPAG